MCPRWDVMINMTFEKFSCPAVFRDRRAGARARDKESAAAAVVIAMVVAAVAAAYFSTNGANEALTKLLRRIPV